MHNLLRMREFIFIILTLFVHFGLDAKRVDTFYGPLEVSEPVLLELIDSPPMQRLKKVYQYGISHFASPFRENYTRYEHSLGVFAILRMNNAPLVEQVAGLLHDVSHTVFSHVGDHIFDPQAPKEAAKSYQDDIHLWFLTNYGITKILEKYGISPQQITPSNESFPRLEEALPNLCADRIDYNLQGAFYRGFLTKKEVLEIAQDLSFKKGRWVSTKTALMKKMAQFTLFMNLECWGSAENYIISGWLAEIFSKALQLRKITFEDIHFGTDELIWNRLRQIPDPFIQERFYRILHPKRFYSLVEPDRADIVTSRKFRGIDPWIQTGSAVMRLTEMDQELRDQFEEQQELLAKGWAIKLAMLSQSRPPEEESVFTPPIFA